MKKVIDENYSMEIKRDTEFYNSSFNRTIPWLDRRWPYVGLMLGQRHRRWPNIKPTIWLVYVGEFQNITGHLESPVIFGRTMCS